MAHLVEDTWSNLSSFSARNRNNAIFTQSKSVRSVSTKEDVALLRGKPASFFTQVLASIRRDVVERKQAWCSLILEIIIPIICVLLTVIIWTLFGDEIGKEENYINYSSIPPNGGFYNYSSHYCYNDNDICPNRNCNLIEGLQPCSMVNYEFNCEGDESLIPVKGLCRDARRHPAFLFAESSVAVLNKVPKLDDLLLNHWAAAKREFGRSNSANLLVAAGLAAFDRFTAVSTNGLIFIGPSDNIPNSFLNYFNTTSIYFKKVYGGTYNKISEINDFIRNGSVFAIIHINNMTIDSFDVDIQMSQKSIPPPSPSIDVLYSGGVKTDRSDIYIVSGFLTLQRMLYDYYMNNILSIPLKEHQFEPYFASMGSLPYKSSKLLISSGKIVAFIIVLAYLYPVTQLARRRVLEKELRIRESMQIMGMKTLSMNISWFIISVTIMFITSLFIALIMRSYMRRSDFFILFLTMFLFSLSAISFAGFIAAFFSKSRMVSMMAPLLYFIAAFPNFAMTSANSTVTSVLCIITPSALSVGLELLFQHEVADGFGTSDFLYILDKPNMAFIFGFFVLDFFLYLILSIYLEEVIPRDWGTSRHPLFFIINPIKYMCGKKHKIIEGGPDGRATNGVFETENPTTSFAVKIKGLRREFKISGKTFTAVNNLYLNIEEGGITVLLGHNGAGKSTTVNMITGMTEPDAGDCIIYGNSIREKLSLVRQDIGFCPQHNILWPELTCGEHLEFFARIKGFKGAALEDAVTKVLQEVDLYDKRDIISSILSGGQKRRLSVAIAFVGGSKFIILDEPTAGMDAAARRYMWDLLLKISKLRTILLTTHFMDEADILGDQIAIMSHGVLQCCGSSLFLKSRLGSGYRISMSLNINTNCESITSLIKNYIPRAKVEMKSVEEVLYRVPTDSFKEFIPLLRELESSLTSLGIRNYTVEGTTLDDVFMRVIEEEEKEGFKSLPNNNDNSSNIKDTIWKYDRLVNSNDIIFMQFSAMVKKRFLCTIRDWRMLCFQILCPVICVLLSVILDRINFTQPSTIFLTPKIFPFNTKTDTSGCKNFFPTQTYTPLGSKYSVYMNDLNMLNSLNMSWYHIDNYFYHSLPHYISYSCSDPEYKKIFNNTPILMFYNSSLFHGAPIALNTLYTMILQTILNNSIELYTSATLLSSSDDDFWADTVKTILKGLIIMIPFSILPSNCVTWVVKENECGARRLQNLAGLRFFVYWCTNFLFDMFAFIVTMVLVLLIFIIFQQKAYASSDTIGPTFILLMIFGLTGTSMAYALSFGFKTHTSAQTKVMVIGFAFGFLLVNLVFILSLLEGFENTSDTLRWPFRLVPTFAVGEGILNLATLSQKQVADPTITPWSFNIILWPCIFMLIEFPIFIIITLLLDHPLLRMRWQRLAYHPDFTINHNNNNNNNNNPFNNINDEDSDVDEERSMIYDKSRSGFLAEDAVIVLDLHKVYHNNKINKIAIHNLAFSVGPSEVFAFLGTNGAGKTTTISILCQDILPTAGKAFICGFDVVKEAEFARACVGYCPQFDAVLDLLTIEEHLKLYANILGVPHTSQGNIITLLSQLCGLRREEYENIQVRHLSGGNKRKLSLALSLIGGPRVLLLDEPTAGMDPIARRQVWKLISQISQYCSIVLTTHHLEEVEALADCVGIMVNGSLKCIGNKTHLKNKYGSGYEMHLKIKEEGCQEIVKNFIKYHFPFAQLTECRGLRCVYTLPKETLLSVVFEILEENKNILGITDYGVAHTSIEQVFMRITEGATRL